MINNPYLSAEGVPRREASVTPVSEGCLIAYR